MTAASLDQKEAVLPNGKKSDLNLFGLFSNGNGEIFATAEKGQLLISRDKGNTGKRGDRVQGSFWCGVALPNGVLLVGGLRGTLMRSEDNGHTWSRATLDTRNSITALASRAPRYWRSGSTGCRLKVPMTARRSSACAPRPGRRTPRRFLRLATSG